MCCCCCCRPESIVAYEGRLGIRRLADCGEWVCVLMLGDSVRLVGYAVQVDDTAPDTERGDAAECCCWASWCEYALSGTLGV